MRKLKKSLNKRLKTLEEAKNYYFNYNKTYKEIENLKSLKIKIDLETLFLRNYNEKRQEFYSVELLNRWNSRNFERDSEIGLVVVDRNFRILDNFEGVCTAFLLELDEIEISIDFSREVSEGTAIGDLSKDECRAFIELKNRCHSEAVSIVWAPAIKHIDEIKEEIEKNYPILKTYNIAFKDKDAFANYVKKIYEYDGTEEFIRIKTERLVKSEFRIIGIIYEIGDLQIDSKKGDSIKVGNLKDHIRRSYRERVDNYIFDVVYHAAFSREECLHLSEVLKDAEKYGGEFL
ncbi:hypothetical protein PM10SUCC1_06830 [Propionigenium maris DSM 9537]|uniref:Uncharacterized protein n=1 Tax=Propionigenium maris DSM 9537 TaxID=1123000 RepID=A0A9W6GJ66_9FUSO|nr:hypothetical protein [Propionigenium maris]GLI55168.1 hypothetical protein PM10SUCC1_06830 [Propionigenium maris DSM 9537]